MVLDRLLAKRVIAFALASVLLAGFGGVVDAIKPSIIEAQPAEQVMEIQATGDAAAAQPETDPAADPEPDTDPLDGEAEVVTPVANTFQIPAYEGAPYTEVNGNVPVFSAAARSHTASMEVYGSLDDLGRVTGCFANIGQDLMPDSPREDIHVVTPTGWVQASYDSVDGGVLYNRGHLIGWQLTAENANPQNLMTLTRACNADGMVPFEDQVADYVRTTGNHVLYRATPWFEGDDLLARGIQLEALSVEDGGAGVSFNVFVHNVQAGIVIDYATGESRTEVEAEPAPEPEPEPAPAPEPEPAPEPVVQEPGEATAADERSYVLNTNTLKVHKPGCRYVKTIKDSNRSDVTARLADLLALGYEGCKVCDPY